MIQVCESLCNGSHFHIVDDPSISHLVGQARDQFLSSRPSPFSIVDITVLLPDSSSGEIVWRRGGYQPYELGYPASTVKLAYMAAAVQWCINQGRSANCLDNHVRPMIKNSDNLQTGIIVDICSGAPNLNLTSTDDPLFQPWYNQRLWAMNYLDSYDLLGNQTINVKTYPTNTGQTLWGAEYLSWDVYGRNEMCSQCAASLMLEVTQGGLFGFNKGLPFGPTEYMRELLSHETWSGESSFGFGIPPGSLLLNKIGVAYDNLNDIALIQLPNGNYFIMAAYSNGYEPNQPYPYDGSNLGVLIELVIDQLDLLSGPCSPPIIKQSISTLTTTGTWKQQSANDAYENQYLISNDETATASWSIDIPATGLYEVCIWSPQSSQFTSKALVQVHSVTGEYNFTITQQSYGGRWYKLGDFYFVKGTSQKIINIQALPGSGSMPVVANAMKISQWPECHHSPGALCRDFDPSGPVCDQSTQTCIDSR